MWLLLASTLTLAAACLLHFALLMRAVGSKASPLWLRLLTLPLPPLAAYVGWRAGARALLYLWALAWVAYAGLATQVL